MKITHFLPCIDQQVIMDWKGRLQYRKGVWVLTVSVFNVYLHHQVAEWLPGRFAKNWRVTFVLVFIQQILATWDLGGGASSYCTLAILLIMILWGFCNNYVMWKYPQSLNLATKRRCWFSINSLRKCYIS